MHLKRSHYYNPMIAEEDSILFEAAKRAQVSRNTAIHVIESTNSSRLLTGAFVRVLLEMPTHTEGYMVARIHSTTAGEPYSGFSTNPTQTTNAYLMLELPPPLAAINGVQYQLNSVSNSGMAEGEFREWLHMVRSEPTLRLPTVQELMDVTARLHPLEVNRHRTNMHTGASVNGSLSAQVRAGAVGAFGIVSPAQLMQQQQQQQRALSARGPTGQRRHSLSGSSQGPLFPSLLQEGRLVSSSDTLPQNPTVVSGEVPGVVGNACGNTSPSGNNGSTRLVQGTVMTRDYNRNPREDGQASHEIPNAEGPGVDVHASAPGTRHQRQRTTSPRSQSGCVNMSGDSAGGPSSSPLAALTMCSPTDERVESEEEVMERRMRQEIMNHLSQEYVLFPKDAQGYKLSRLRLLERDMVEYLQHVHDEIQSKQENCIVCMDHVPTVILLPCKHKVMCRLCAPSCPTCPVCRSKITEMFEPEEI